MESREFSSAGVHLLKLEQNSDLLESVENYCRENKIEAALVNALGTVQEANLGFYDQQAQKYVSHYLEEPLEMILATGNVSLKDGKPFIHLHGFFSSDDLNVIGGHVFEGTIVYAVEVNIQELAGEAPERKPDKNTGLNLWDLS
ncbi:MAG: PPC domain-containing DNA-binding protein [bacterium]